MTDRTALQDLLAKLEKASGSDREMDEQVALVLGLIPTGKEWKKTGHATWHKNLRLDWNGAKFDECFQPALYTASLDASIALVERMLPLGTWDLNNDCDHHAMAQARVWVKTWGDDETAGHVSHAPTPALALLSALLRAMIAKEAK